MKDIKIKLIIIFGSRARRTFNKRSDTDIAVLADRELSLNEKGDLGEDIAKKLNISDESIDIVDLWNAPPLLQHQVAENGKIFYGSKEDFIRFRVLAWRRYQDTAKFRRARRESIKKI